MCFSLVFSTVFQAYLTTFLIESGYKTPIQNTDELYESGIKLCYEPSYNYIFENGDETEISNVQRNRSNCESYMVYVDWAIYHRNVSVLLPDLIADSFFGRRYIFGENSEPLLCRLEDVVVYNNDLRIVMLKGDPLLRRISEIIDRVVEAGFYNFWISQGQYLDKVEYQIMGIVNQLDGYYSFNLYHMQPAFYIRLMGWCLSAFCFMFELLYNRHLRKRK